MTLPALLKERTRRTLAEDARADAELDVHKLRVALRIANDRIAQLTLGSAAPRPGGRFFKREHFGMEGGKIHELVKGDQLTDPNSDGYLWKWSRAALVAGLGRGRVGVFDICAFYRLPTEIHAENLWHLCAQVGLSEGFARLCYRHPPSAVQAAKGIS